VLEAGECVLVFPEGVRGMNKLYKERYKLQRFGTGFMRLALEAQTPIVPVAVVGSESRTGVRELRAPRQTAPACRRFDHRHVPAARPLGILPMPVKYHLYFG